MVQLIVPSTQQIIQVNEASGQIAVIRGGNIIAGGGGGGGDYVELNPTAPQTISDFGLTIAETLDVEGLTTLDSGLVVLNDATVGDTLKVLGDGAAANLILQQSTYSNFKLYAIGNTLYLAKDNNGSNPYTTYMYLSPVLGFYWYKDFFFTGDGDTIGNILGENLQFASATDSVVLKAANLQTARFHSTTNNVYWYFRNSDNYIQYDNLNKRMYVILDGATALELRDPTQSPTFRVEGTYASTTGSAANVYIDSNDYFYRSTSSRKYKKNIVSLPDHSAYSIVEGLNPVEFESTAIADKGTQRVGFIAEEVDLVDSRFVNRNDDDEPEGVEYAHIVAPLVSVIKDLIARVDQLESELEALR